jgi:hypothetical protein
MKKIALPIRVEDGQAGSKCLVAKDAELILSTQDATDDELAELVRLVNREHAVANPVLNGLALEDVLEIINCVINSYESEGCEDCGTISSDVYQRLATLRDSLTVTQSDNFTCLHCGGTCANKDGVSVSIGDICDACADGNAVYAAIADWKHHVSEDNTKLGFAEWMIHQREAEENPEKDDNANYTEILQHRIEWWLRGEDAPSELDEGSVEHIKKLIEDGYNQGELFVTGDDGDDDHDATEYRGWWSISN